MDFLQYLLGIIHQSHLHIWDDLTGIMMGIFQINGMEEGRALRYAFLLSVIGAGFLFTLISVGLMKAMGHYEENRFWRFVKIWSYFSLFVFAGGQINNGGDISAFPYLQSLFDHWGDMTKDIEKYWQIYLPMVALLLFSVEYPEDIEIPGYVRVGLFFVLYLSSQLWFGGHMRFFIFILVFLYVEAILIEGRAIRNVAFKIGRDKRKEEFYGV